jgi:hypothetical protein
MARTDISELLQQLQSEDAKARRQAASALGKHLDPVAITPLAVAYKSDSDAGVRKAAEASLRKFRAKQVQETGEGGSGSGGANRALNGLRALLLLTLIVSLIGNAALFLADNAPAVTGGSEDQLPESNREELIENFQQRLQTIRTEMTDRILDGEPAITVREQITQLKFYAENNQAPICKQLPPTNVRTASMSGRDVIRYPDLPNVNTRINEAATEYLNVRNELINLCGSPDGATLVTRVAAFGGVDQFIIRYDRVLNEFVNGAQGELQRAIDNPAPTVEATSTPTNAPAAPVEGQATITPGGSAPTLDPLEATIIAGQTLLPGLLASPTPIPPTPTPTETPAPTLNYTGPNTPPNATYSVQVRYTIRTAAGANANGSFLMNAIVQETPRTAQYILTLQEDTPDTWRLNIVSSFPLPLYAQGEGRYVIKDGFTYRTGAGAVGCERLPDSGAVGQQLSLLTPSFFLPEAARFTGTGLRLVGTIGDIQQFEGRLALADGSATQVFQVDQSLSKGIPVRVSYRLDQVAAPNATGTVITSYFVEYTLTASGGEVNVSGIVAPSPC